MPKVTPIQDNFSGGEFGQLSDGRVTSEQYKTGVEKCLNYIPSIEGPAIRRPGTKYVADAKNPAQPPTLIPFRFSEDEQYMLEFGNKNVRFYYNNAQLLVTGTTTFSMQGMLHGLNGTITAYGPGFALRNQRLPEAGEALAGFAFGIGSGIVSGSTLTVGDALEMQTPYTWEQAQGLKYYQKDDFLFLACSSQPLHTLQRFGHKEWTLKPLLFRDGPYLPYNSYRLAGDSSNIKLRVKNSSNNAVEQYILDIITDPKYSVTATNGNGPEGAVQLTVEPRHSFRTGDRVYIFGVEGTVEANNNGVRLTHAVSVISSTVFDLVGTKYVSAFTGSGWVYPALFPAKSLNDDINTHVNERAFAFIQNSTRFWGHIITRNLTGSSSPLVPDIPNVNGIAAPPVGFRMVLDQREFKDNSALTNSNYVADYWQFGITGTSKIVGHPSDVLFYQNRLFLCGIPGYPSKIIASESGFFDSFRPSNTGGLAVRDSDGFNFDISVNDKNPFYWMVEGRGGIYAASASTEALISPSGDRQALTPTNFNAEILGKYGSADIKPTESGDGHAYIQRSQRKIREVNLFHDPQVNKSILLNKLADHITFPDVIDLATCNVPYPSVYALKSNGNIAAMSFDRDDVKKTQGWYEIELGGRVDSSDNAPDIKSIERITDLTGKYDQLWMVVQRYINGTQVTTIEYMDEPFKPDSKQRDAYYLDCGFTHNSSVVITGITQSGSARVTATAHGFGNSDRILITDIVGLNSSLVDINGVVTNSNLVNEQTFAISDSAANAFSLKYIHNSNYVDSLTYTPYFSGGRVRKLVGQIQNLTWLKGETVKVLADGKIHGDVAVNSAGVLALTFSSAIVSLGYGYKSRLKTLRPDAGSATGSATGAIRRPHKIGINVENVGDLSIGTEFSHLHPLSFPDGPNATIPLFKGVLQEAISGLYDYDGQICVEQSSPLPGIIKSITIMMDEFDV